MSSGVPAHAAQRRSEEPAATLCGLRRGCEARVKSCLWWPMEAHAQCCVPR